MEKDIAMNLTGTRQTLVSEENLSGILMIVIGLITLPVHAKILVMMLTQPSSYSWLHWWPATSL